MNVSSPQSTETAARASAVSADDAADKTRDESHQDAESSPFARLLASKSPKLPGKVAEGPINGTPEAGRFGVMEPPSDRPQSMAPVTQTAEPLRAVAIPRELEGVVREIAAGVNATGASEVRIELTSKTLNGLQIQIQKHEGKIDVSFLSNTDDVARLLSRNVSELTQALADRGVAVHEVRIQTQSGEGTPRAQEYKSSSRQQDRGRGGQGGGGGQGRNRR